MVHTELHAIFFGRGDHRVGVLKREGDRLFHDHVRAGFETVAHDLPLDAAAESGRRKLGLLLREHGAVVRVERDAAALLLRNQRERLFAVFLHKIAEGDDLQSGLQCGADMVGADHAAADEGVFHKAFPFFIRNIRRPRSPETGTGAADPFSLLRESQYCCDPRRPSSRSWCQR